MKKWCNYPGVVGQKKGRGYPPKRVVPGIRAVLVPPYPPDISSTELCSRIPSLQEYMPLVFRNLRERFGITEKVFANSFFIQPKPLEQTGHSGSKFFLTDDGKFWVKTMASEDVEV